MTVKDVIKELKGNKYIFIGEIHGTKEIPKIVKELVKEVTKNRQVIFCVELPKQIEKDLDEFLNKKISKEKLLSSNYLRDALSDNRLNDDMISIYEELHKENIKIKCLEDYHLEDVNKRDKAMADNLKAIIEKEKADLFMIYAGNMHVMDKSMEIKGFVVNPMKIYLNKSIIDQAITIQFNEGRKESISFDKDTKTFNWSLKLKDARANKFQL